MNIDRNQCKKYDKYQASNLEIFIPVELAVNKIVICEWFSLNIQLNWNKNLNYNDF